MAGTKRAADSSTSDGRAKKVPRTNSAGPNRNAKPKPQFEPEHQVAIDDVAEIISSGASDSGEKFVDAKVFMCWAPVGTIQVLRFQLTALEGQSTCLEVAIHHQRSATQLRISPKQLVKLSLKGAELIKTAPPKIVYRSGVILERREHDQKKNGTLFNFFEEDWFSTPGPDQDAMTVDGSSSEGESDDNRSMTSENTKRKRRQKRRSKKKKETLPPVAEEKPEVTAEPATNGGGSYPTPTPSASPPPADHPISVPQASIIGPTSSKGKHGAAVKFPVKIEKPQQATSEKTILTATDHQAALSTEAGPSMSKAQRKKEKEMAEVACPPPPQAGYHCSEAGGRYTSIAELRGKAKAKHSFVGIVVEMGEVRETNRGDWSLLLSIVDPSFVQDPEVLSCIFFAKPHAKDALPNVELRQPLLLRMMMVEDFQGRPQAKGFNDSLKWVAYDPESGSPTYGDGEVDQAQAQASRWRPTTADLDYFKHISDWWQGAEEDVTPTIVRLLAQKSRTTGRKSIGTHAAPIQPAEEQHRKRGLVLIKDVQARDFFDCVVQVFRFWSLGHDRTDCYVSDWSYHPKLKEHFDGAAPGCVMKISIWKKLGIRANDLQPGFYRFKNVFTKMDDHGLLEGKLSTDELKCIQLLSEECEEVQVLLRRRAAVQNDSQVINDFPEGGVVDEDCAVEAEANGSSSGEGSSCKPLIVHPHMDEDVTPVSQVKACDTFPRKFRIRARVTDHRPLDLKKWVRKYCYQCNEDIKTPLQHCAGCLDEAGKYTTMVFRFVLRVQDEEGEELVVAVGGEHASKLLSAFKPGQLSRPEGFQAFRDYVAPMFWASPDNGGTPFLDLVIAARHTEKGPVYSLYGGCELQQRHP